MQVNLCSSIDDDDDDGNINNNNKNGDNNNKNNNNNNNNNSSINRKKKKNSNSNNKSVRTTNLPKAEQSTLTIVVPPWPEAHDSNKLEPTLHEDAWILIWQIVDLLILREL